VKKEVERLWMKLKRGKGEEKVKLNNNIFMSFACTKAGFSVFLFDLNDISVSTVECRPVAE
jgi:hypothetical protein